MKKNITTIFCVVMMIFSICSCKKFLDQKPQKNLQVPSSLLDLQQMLDAYPLINVRYPNLSEVLSDNYYLKPASWNTLDESSRNLYLWKSDDLDVNNWSAAYSQILTCNVVLEALNDIKYEDSDLETHNSIKGAALFLRAYYFQSLANLYANPYDKISASNDLGIVLRLSTDFKERSIRSTVQETYNRIILDLKEAESLLPEIPMIKSRPSKPAVYGSLARTYLAMQEYDSAGVYADKCLRSYSELMDFNTLDSNSLAPIKRFNKEVIFHMISPVAPPLRPTLAIIDPDLYNSYGNGDLRRVVYFRINTDKTYRFKGDYDGTGTQSGYVFGGIVTDEMFLIRAECRARQGRVVEAMGDLNHLIKSRWKKTALFTPINATTIKEAVRKVLAERRKELIFRGTRWVDLRRLRNESDYSVTPKRLLNSETFELSPNSARYTLKIPREVINMSGISQNQ